ncbi:MAG TPA: LuxR C-terminal-related transcriptional regulator [Polyangiales bacterium]|jgi:DNA-binding CsgD family transcriptional regulator|nr:LuxR C-terminal-related transcriptional regulator [Polyangiales bacterium]
MQLRPSHEYCDRVQQLWDQLIDFEAGELEPALNHCMRGLSKLIAASNVTWVGFVRLVSPRDAAFGWRPRILRVLHPAAAMEERMKRGRLRLKRGTADVTTVEVWRGAGSFRAHRFCDLVEPDWFESDYYRDQFLSQGIHDALFSYYPINSQSESAFGLFRGADMPPFSEAEREELAYAVRGIKWFHRRLLLAHGLLVASKPITPTERRVLQELLKGEPEKTIAAELGQTYNSTHEHVANIYRKFGINSRSELMAIWLGKQFAR